MKATNIQWDIDIEEAYEKLDSMNAHSAAAALGVPARAYANATTEERHDYAYELFHHSPATLEDFMGLPDTVDIPVLVIREYDGDDVLADNEGDNAEFAEYISNWLSDRFGYCHEGFVLEKTIEDEIEPPYFYGGAYYTGDGARLYTREEVQYAIDCTADDVERGYGKGDNIVEDYLPI